MPASAARSSYKQAAISFPDGAGRFRLAEISADIWLGSMQGLEAMVGVPPWGLAEIHAHCTMPGPGNFDAGASRARSVS